MLVACWSAKGGSGTSVVAAALALVLAGRSPDEVLLVDVDGDQPALLGVPAPVPTGPAASTAVGSVGVRDWLAAGDAVGAEALRRLEIEVRPGLRLLPWGEGGGRPGAVDGGADGAAARLLTAVSDGMPAGVLGGRPVVVDCGVVRSNHLGAAVAAGAGMSLLVLRPCYLALRRAVDAPTRPSGVVLVTEPGARALSALDVEDALGVPVQAVVRWSADVARAVDAGVLPARLPRALSAPLRRLPA